MKTSLFHYSDAYILVKGTILIKWEGNRDVAKGAEERAKWIMFKCLIEINNTKIYNAKYLDIATMMLNFTEFSNSHLKTIGTHLKFCADDVNATIRGKNNIFM